MFWPFFSRNSHKPDRPTPFGRTYRPKLEPLEERLALYAVSGYEWSNVNVTASFMPDGTITDGGLPSNLFSKMDSVAPTAVWQKEFARALQTWSTVSPLNFHFVSDNGAPDGSSGLGQGDSHFGDIRFGGYVFSIGYVAYTYFPTGSTRGGDEFFNTATTVHIGTNLDFYSVFLHETGHALGLDHSTLSTAVMYPSISTVFPGLSADDIAGIQAIYGARQADAYDSGSGNNSFASGTSLTLNGSGAVTFNADLTSLADVDYYRVTAPASFDGTLAVSVDARNLSLLSPKISVYDAAQNLLGTVAAATYGDVATINLSGLAAGQTYYLVPDGASSDVFGMGAYQLTAQFGGVSVPTLPSLSINSVSLLEGDSGATALAFTVSLSAASTSPVTVQFTTADGSATAGSDYVATSGTLTFAAGETQKTITVSGSGDTSVESDETFFVNLTAPTNSTLADGQGQGTLQNDDAVAPSLPTLSINSVSVLEGNSGTTALTFTVSLSAASADPITVQYATADGTATTAGSDYAAASGTLTFAPGVTQQTITVLANGDLVAESSETFFVNLSSPTGATLQTSQGTGTIANDDLAADRYEVNNSSAAATNFGKTARVSQSSLTLHTATDVDFYKFTPNKKGLYTVTIAPTQGSGTLNLTVLNSSLAVLASSQSASGGVSLSVNLAAGQTYYVKALSSTGSPIGYNLNVAKSSGGALSLASTDTSLAAAHDVALSELTAKGSLTKFGADLAARSALPSQPTVSASAAFRPAAAQQNVGAVSDEQPPLTTARGQVLAGEDAFWLNANEE